MNQKQQGLQLISVLSLGAVLGKPFEQVIAAAWLGLKEIDKGYHSGNDLWRGSVFDLTGPFFGRGGVDGEDLDEEAF